VSENKFVFSFSLAGLSFLSLSNLFVVVVVLSEAIASSTEQGHSYLRFSLRVFVGIGARCGMIFFHFYPFEMSVSKYLFTAQFIVD